MPAVAVGVGLTVTVALAVPRQPLLSVTVTVYDVVAAGVATGLAIVELDKFVVGVQL